MITRIKFRAIGLDELLQKIREKDAEGFSLVRVENIDEIFTGSFLSTDIFEVKMIKKEGGEF